MFEKHTSEDNWLVKMLAGAALSAVVFFTLLGGSVAHNLRLVPDIAAAQVALTPEVLGVSTINVSNATELNTALGNATGGETIVLAPGNYGVVSMNNLKFTSEVTIVSQDSSNPAVFDDGSEIQYSDHITIDGITFKARNLTSLWDATLLVNSSGNLTIRNSIFDGEFVNGYGFGRGFDVRSGNDIKFENNTLFRYHVAAIISNVNNLQVLNNDTYEVRADGYDFVAVSNVLIEGNYIHDFKPNSASGDHADMIQFWTAGTNVSSFNVTIRNNILDSGTGGWTQSLFMANELGNVTSRFYKNFLIENNLIYNAHLHGITMGEIDGVVIKNNTILQNLSTSHAGEQWSESDPIWTPQLIVAGNSTNVQVSNNIVSANGGVFNSIVTDLQDSSTHSGNVVINTSEISTNFDAQLNKLTNIAGGSTLALNSGTGTGGGTPTPTPTPTPAPTPSPTTTDTDGDGIADTADNCPNTANASQTDTDGDGTGDACDSTSNGDPTPESVPTPTPDPANDVKTGDEVETTDNLNVRDEAGGDVVIVAPEGSGGTVTDSEPEEANGHVYVEVEFEDGTEGWVASEYLEISDEELSQAEFSDLLQIIASLRAEIDRLQQTLDEVSTSVIDEEEIEDGDEDLEEQNEEDEQIEGDEEDLEESNENDEEQVIDEEEINDDDSEIVEDENNDADNPSSILIEDRQENGSFISVTHNGNSETFEVDISVSEIDELIAFLLGETTFTAEEIAELMVFED